VGDCQVFIELSELIQRRARDVRDRMIGVATSVVAVTVLAFIPSSAATFAECLVVEGRLDGVAPAERTEVKALAGDTWDGQEPCSAFGGDQRPGR
jgi:hypothetical protein